MTRLVSILCLTFAIGIVLLALTDDGMAACLSLHSHDVCHDIINP